jgi:hypothetical protein
MLIPFLSLRWGIKSILKKVHPWLGEVDSQALQMASRSMDTAYKNFFQRKEALHAGTSLLRVLEDFQYV